MTLLDAVHHHRPPTKGRRVWISLACAAIAIGIVAYSAWNLPAEHRVEAFFAAVEAKDYPRAFAIWHNDPDWQQHPQRYAEAGYSYGRFLNDWGTNSEYGTIRKHKILHATSRYGNTTLVVVDINGRPATLLTLAVQKHARGLTFPPFSLAPVETGFGWKDWQISYR